MLYHFEDTFGGGRGGAGGLVGMGGDLQGGSPPARTESYLYLLLIFFLHFCKYYFILHQLRRLDMVLCATQ